jgi:hypothetical protein
MTVDRIMIRYRLKAGQLEHHLSLLHAVYEELEPTVTEGLHYGTFQLDDELEFVDIASAPLLPGPLPRLESFQRYRAELEERCEWMVAEELHQVASFRFP